jgi:predicted ATP-dependent endonuclease of OLD family
MPKLKGVVESSILSGTRFTKVNSYIKEKLEYKEGDTINKVSSFIIENMNYILYGTKQNRYKFNNLYQIEATRKLMRTVKGVKGENGETKKESYIANFTYIALKLNDNDYIKEHLFSTGEYFLLKLLKFLDTFKTNKNNVVPALIIIDEIELSLHPLAQSRLIQKLNELSGIYNLIVIFASHSLQILDYISPDNTYYIRKNAFD